MTFDGGHSLKLWNYTEKAQPWHSQVFGCFNVKGVFCRFYASRENKWQRHMSFASEIHLSVHQFGMRRGLPQTIQIKGAGVRRLYACAHEETKGNQDATLQHWPWCPPCVLHPAHCTEKLAGAQRENTDTAGTEPLWKHQHCRGGRERTDKTRVRNYCCATE